VNQINNKFNGFSNFKSQITVCNDEIELVNTFFQLVNNWDPEVICGYEVSNTHCIICITCYKLSLLI